MKTYIMIETNESVLKEWKGREKEVEMSLRADLQIPDGDKVTVRFSK